MLPSIQHGDFIIYKPLHKDHFPLNLGEIIVCLNPTKKSQLMVKRVHKVYQYGIEIRGDNIEKSIDSRQFGIIQNNSIIGVVDRIISREINN